MSQPIASAITTLETAIAAFELPGGARLLRFLETLARKNIGAMVIGLTSRRDVDCMVLKSSVSNLGSLLTELKGDDLRVEVSVSYAVARNPHIKRVYTFHGPSFKADLLVVTDLRFLDYMDFVAGQAYLQLGVHTKTGDPVCYLAEHVRGAVAQLTARVMNPGEQCLPHILAQKPEDRMDPLATLIDRYMKYLGRGYTMDPNYMNRLHEEYERANHEALEAECNAWFEESEATYGFHGAGVGFPPTTAPRVSRGWSGPMGRPSGATESRSIFSMVSQAVQDPPAQSLPRQTPTISPQPTWATRVAGLPDRGGVKKPPTEEQMATHLALTGKPHPYLLQPSRSS
jgi:hypothetical protein